MRIAYVCHYFVPEPAAPAARVHELSRAWVQAGHQVTVVTAFPNFPTGVVPAAYRGTLATAEWLDGIRVLRNWLYARPNRGVGNRGFSHLSFMVTAVLFGLPRLGPVDVVIASSPTLFSAVSGWLIARLKRAPFVMEVRDLWPEAFVEVGVMRPGMGVRVLSWLARFLYRQAALVVPVTHGFADRLAEQGVPRSKLEVVPNGADTRLFTPAADASDAKARLGLAGRFIALYAGSHGLSHGLGALLEAAGRQPDVTYLLVGDGAAKPDLEAQRRERGLSNVVMLPSVPKQEVPALYAAADVSLVPLRNVPIFGTFIPSKLFEALAAGKPVVGAVRGEARAILERSGGALVVEPEDGAAIAEAVATLRANPAHCAEMGRRGRKFVEREYDRDRLAERYLARLREVVER